MEIWKDIPNYEGTYQVSTYGNVKSLKRKYRPKELILSLLNTNKDYLQVVLYLNKKSKRYNVHTLVAIAFLNHKPNGYNIVVNHKNFNKKDNNVKNLELISARENSNKKHLKSSSKYVGVHFSNKKNKWVSSIFINRKVIHLGYFDKEFNAHLAYKNKLNQYLK